MSHKIAKNIGKIFLAVSFFLFAFAPMTLVLAQTNTVTKPEGIVTDCYNGDTGEDVPCDNFNQLVTAVQSITNIAVVDIALPFSVIVIIYVGAEYVMNSDNPSKRSEATKRFEKVAWGIFWVLGAWLVINLIMTALVNTGNSGVPLLLNNSS